MNIVRKVKELNLSGGSYVVVGSGTLAALGIREAKDIDLVASREVYARLKQEGWEEKFHDDGSSFLEHDIYEASLTWDSKDNNPNLIDLLQDAHIVDGVPFVNVRRLMEWKKRKGREKDIVDMALIQRYLIG